MSEIISCVSVTNQGLRIAVRTKMEEDYEVEWQPIPEGEPLAVEKPAPLSMNPVSNVLSVRNLMSGKIAKVQSCCDGCDGCRSSTEEEKAHVHAPVRSPLTLRLAGGQYEASKAEGLCHSPQQCPGRYSLSEPSPLPFPPFSRSSSSPAVYAATLLHAFELNLLSAPVDYYCHEASEGYQVSRDEVYRLQQMSRQMPFDDVMAKVGTLLGCTR